MWLNRFAKFVVGSTFLLIIAGGLVTSQNYGLAVPDWPKSYGQWMPPMVGGVLFEHGHRMVAGFVGILTILLTCWVWLSRQSRTVRFLTTGALLAVILQALLGGLTVLYKLPTAVSVMHATLAQTFFMMIVCVALITSRSWGDEAKLPADSRTAILCVVSVCFIYLQLILGAWMRHTNSAQAIPDFPLSLGRVIPEFSSPEIAIHFAHRVNALLVFIFTSWSVSRIVYRYPDLSALFRPAALLMGLLIVQIILGAFTVWTRTAVVVATSHVAVGAVLLACSVVLAVRSFRYLRYLPEGVRSNQFTEALAKAV